MVIGAYVIRRQMDKSPPAHRWLLKHTCVPPLEVSTSQEEERTQRVEERDKKRMLSCNGIDRGSDFALTRKGADLSYGISWQEAEVNL